MKFWKEHVKLRVSLIAAFALLGVIATILGWKMTGQILGLLLMLVGVALLVAALWIYNKPFETPKKKRKE